MTRANTLNLMYYGPVLRSRRHSTTQEEAVKQRDNEHTSQENKHLSLAETKSEQYVGNDELRNRGICDVKWQEQTNDRGKNTTVKHGRRSIK